MRNCQNFVRNSTEQKEKFLDDRFLTEKFWKRVDLFLGSEKKSVKQEYLFNWLEERKFWSNSSIGLIKKKEKQTPHREKRFFLLDKKVLPKLTF